MPIEWREPPAAQDPTKPKWTTEATLLRTRLNTWGELIRPPDDEAYPGSPQALARNISTGSLAAFRPAGSYEAVVRMRRIYVRFVGEPNTDTPTGTSRTGK